MDIYTQNQPPATPISPITTPPTKSNHSLRNFNIWSIICIVANIITSLTFIIGLTSRQQFQNFLGVIVLFSSNFAGLIAAPILFYNFLVINRTNTIKSSSVFFTKLNIGTSVILSNVSILLSIIILFMIGDKNQRKTQQPIMDNQIQMIPTVPERHAIQTIQQQAFHKTNLFFTLAITVDIITIIATIWTMSISTPKNLEAVSMMTGLMLFPLMILGTVVNTFFCIINFTNLHSIHKKYQITPTNRINIFSWMLIILSIIPLLMAFFLVLLPNHY